MLDYDTAKELAQRAAATEARRLAPHESYVIVDDLSHEHSWGWSFEPVLEPYHAPSEPYSRRDAWWISVDRFSGKILMSPYLVWRSDQCQILDLVLVDAGNNSTDLYHFLRQYKGWTASETDEAMRDLPCTIAAGPPTSINPVSTALIDRGATVELRQRTRKATL